MKKTIISLVTVLLSLCLLAVLIAACSGESEEPGVLYAVVYRSNDETENPYAVEQYAAGETFTVPAAEDLTEGRSGFLAWYDGVQRITAGDTYTMPVGGITFYAQWEGDVTARLEGIWSGCKAESEHVGEGNSLVASIQTDERYAYVILSTVSRESAEHTEEKENKILRLAECGDGIYASETESIRLINNHLVMSLGEEGTIEFEDWCPLSTAPKLNGIWTTPGSEERRSIEFTDTAVLSHEDATVIGKVVGIGEYYLFVPSEDSGDGTVRAAVPYPMMLFTATPDGNTLLVNNGVVLIRE